ncbi:uncharacterized protein LOC135809380 [Sycon ciliatum]|uniref:uncharacterized protein LOC135809380 n=1 Tax=Sycon ciliatum TaxID=27933 RepID=UPI0020A92F8E|eukprot:scpid47366/ scgid23047/ Putative glucose-6-phosphate 1-epimerase; Putative D-hexose-6-phosphate mutarotase; Putative apospory-associated protein C
MDAKDTVVISLDDKNTVTVHLYGATVVSWVCDGEELLFVSTKAIFDNKKAIRGGIPLVFPNFGPWKLGPQHGFARISRFTLDKTEKTDDCAHSVFSLKDSDATRAMWEHRFEFRYHINLSKKSLQLRVEVQNTGSASFDFTTLLHTYFGTKDVTQMSVQGLKGSKFVEREGGDGEAQEEQLIVSDFIDRTYCNTASKHVLTGVGSSGTRTVTLDKDNLPDTVVWNPWKAKAAAMGDFGDDDYPNMLCVEAGYVSQPATVAAGATFEGGVVMTSS